MNPRIQLPEVLINNKGNSENVEEGTLVQVELDESTGTNKFYHGKTIEKSTGKLTKHMQKIDANPPKFT